MSLLTNNNTIHLYNRWCSPWYENSNVYSNLIYSDLYIYELINGIYYQLNIPTSIPFYRELNYNHLIIRVNAHLFRKRKQKRSSLFFYNKTNFFYNYKKIMFLLHKTLFQRKQFYKKYKKNRHKIINYNNLYISYYNTDILVKNNLTYNCFTYIKKKNEYNKFIFFKKLILKKFIKKNNKLKNKKMLLLRFNKTVNFLIGKKRLYQRKKLHLTKKKKKFKQLFGRRKNKLKIKRKKKKNFLKNKFKKNKYKKRLKNKYRVKNKKNIKLFKKKKKFKKYRKQKNINNFNFFIFFLFFIKLLNWYNLLITKLLIVYKLFKKINKISFSMVIVINNSLNILKNKIFTNIKYYNISMYNITCKFYKKLYWFNNYYFFSLLNNLRYKMENTLNLYLGVNLVFFPSYKKKFFNIQDVKLVNDYIKIKLQSRRSIVKVMRKLVKIYSFQRYKMRLRNFRYKRKLMFFKKKINRKLKLNKFFLKKIHNKNYICFFLKNKYNFQKKLTKWKYKFKYFNYKHYPLIGIRIECNGPSKKGRRTKMITYNEWVNYYKLPGKMPYTTKMADVHYWQNYARTKRAAIGIKVWLFFNTLLYSNKTKKQINIKIKQ